MYLFNYIVFIFVMVMSCNVISVITCIMYFLCKILIVCGIKCVISFNYIVRVIRKVITCFIVIEVIICFL